MRSECRSRLIRHHRNCHQDSVLRLHTSPPHLHRFPPICSA
uniref:Uncharacterized protein n=1 Tax=Parascaris univalens TaxID=6257 RepID=A0A915C968_PARUN